MKHCRRCDRDLPIDDFFRDRSRPDGRSSACADCKRADYRRYVEANGEVLRERQRARYRKAKEVLDLLKSRPCADCGGTFPPYVMEFDHPDPSTKIKEVSNWRSSGYLKGMLAEIARCTLVCANCHRIRTYRQREAGIIKVGRPRKVA